jgi:hypothetical protein
MLAKHVLLVDLAYSWNQLNNFILNLFYEKKDILIYLLLAGCLPLLLITCKQKQSKEEDIVIVDVTKRYPQKEAVPIQDIADVEYIPLETNDRFLCHEAGVFVSIGGEDIIYYNFWGDETIFIFDKNGKAKTRINRKGQSGEEYISLRQVVHDDENNELYVLSINDIIVYDLPGNYKRRFPQISIEDETYGLPYLYDRIYNFNKDYLLCFRDNFACYMNMPSFLIVSKQSGEKVEDISISYEKCIEKYVGSPEKGAVQSIYRNIRPTVKTGSYTILNESSSDTIYKLMPDLSLIPLMARKPSIRNMKIPVFLNINMETSRYYFMTSVKKEEKLPYVPLMYDKQTGEITEQNFYNADDLSKKKVVIGASANEEFIAIDDKHAYLSVPAFQLKKAYDNETLTGKLKKIASNLKEDDNPVLILIKFKS